ncbi:MAG: chromosomal replication initiator protein DnaA [Verrucomicrobiae bacterium]|nr:chromosomal replication initiator protein DnaA [Verrucomicrobiae bacterium]
MSAAPTQALWTQVQKHLQELLKPDIFALWFEPIRPLALNGDCLRLEVRDEFCAMWLTDNYLDLLRSVASRVAVRPMQIEFSVGSGPAASGPAIAVPASAHAESDTPQRNGSERPRGEARSASGVRNGEPSFNPTNTFSTFIVGSNSQMAHSACLAVAQSPGRSYNPLFLFGGVGLGKTHLLNAIGQEVLSHRKHLKVAFLSCERFTNEFIDGLQNNSLARFRRRYRQVDCLLVDDIQFLAGKERIQEEFFHTFNTLHEARKQIVLSCDKPPSEIPGLEQRLISRFEWGLLADLQPPDVETRVAILRQKQATLRVELDPAVIQFLADRIRTNVRRLEGALVRVASFSRLARRPVGLDDVENLLREILQEESRRAITFEIIQKRVAEHYDIRLADMTSKRRPESIAFPRQVAMYLCRNLTEGSLSAIGDAFGGRDHGTVLHAVRAVKNRMEVDPQVRQTVGYLEKQLLR